MSLIDVITEQFVDGLYVAISGSYLIHNRMFYGNLDYVTVIKFCLHVL